MRALRPSPLKAASAATAAAGATFLAYLALSPAPQIAEPVVRIALQTADPLQTSTIPTASERADAQVRASPAPEDDPDIDIAALQERAAAAANDLPDVEPPADAIDADQLGASREEAQVIIPATRVSLVAAPVSYVSEQGPYGPLPRIARDGRRPFEVYARPVHKQYLASDRPKVAILLGGMGLNAQLTNLAIQELPGEITLAFAPYGEKLQGVINRARSAGHEVMLQLPMEPLGYPAVDPGPHTLRAGAPLIETQENLAWLLGRFSGYLGVTNYMGARLTSDAQALEPVMAELKRRGLVYLDDGSSARSQAAAVGLNVGLPVHGAQILIDADPGAQAIRASLRALEERARSEGFAVGVGTGLETTIKVVDEWTATIARDGLLLVPVSALFRDRAG